MRVGDTTVEGGDVLGRPLTLPWNLGDIVIDNPLELAEELEELARENWGLAERLSSEADTLAGAAEVLRRIASEREEETSDSAQSTLTLRDVVLELLKRGPQTAADIKSVVVDEHGFSEKSVYPTLSRLKSIGRVEAVDGDSGKIYALR